MSRAGKAGKAGSRPAYETRHHPEPTEAQLEPTADELRDALPRPDLRDPVVLAERQLLQVVLQQPGLLEPDELDQLDGASFSAPAHRSVWDAVTTAGRPAGARPPPGRGCVR